MQKIRLLALGSLFVLSVAHATLINEKFTANPALAGWQVLGDTNLFQWDAANHNLAVTWDSSQTNSYFYHPLGATFTKADGFCVSFDLNLQDTDATGYFQIAIGLCHFADVTSTNFSRANGSSPNLVEFDYFPDGTNSYGPSIDATLVDANDNFYFAFDTSQPLVNGVNYRVILVHQAGETNISGMVYTNGQVFTALPVIAAYGANDFNLDTLAISSYTTLDDIYGDALLAHGTVDNLTFASPLPVGLVSPVAAGKINLTSDTNWRYTLEQSADFKTWLAAAPASWGNGTNLMLQATNAPADKSFYRVRAELP
jgi:hypothetical protein